MSLPDIDNVKLTNYHLILESTSDESIFGMIAPSKKIGGVKVIGSSHLQVMRYVFTLAIGEDVYFKGHRLQGAPGVTEILSEIFQPGKQLTTRPNGKVTVVETYIGKKNIFSARALEKYKASATLNFLTLFGEDPAPTRTLYGNPAATFLQQGDEKPMAAAYYDGTTKRLELLHHFQRRMLIDNFKARFAGASQALAS